jgi:hypothetical protein
MSTNTDISVLYQEFTAALTEVLAENSVGRSLAPSRWPWHKKNRAV